ncbi:hypothetical protein HAX54_009514 [Datura stramonium]|uniref:Uncharacterized protein n=1 Tax=Datura stramonium TaxID=4076 RepID=A0ABS8WZF7_DATST|nr:hypothetical protein [Datura stramonium]
MNDDIRLFVGRVRQNADGTPVQPPVGFRPLLGICVTSAVCRSEPSTHRLVADGIVVFLVYCFASAIQQRSADTIQQLAGAPSVLPVLNNGFSSLVLI